MKYSLRLIFLLFIIFTINLYPQGKSPFFNVLDYGTKNDGTGHAEVGINAAIQAADAAGGGTVYIPAGTYICGPIKLVSNLELFIEAGALLKFPAQNLPYQKGRNQSIECLTPIPLIGGHDLENVTITGRGTITTNNAEWMKLKPRDKSKSAAGPNWAHLLASLEKHTPATEKEYLAAAAELRPPFIQVMNCKNVLIEGIHIIGSAMWPIHLLYSENVVVQNVIVNTFPGVHTGGIYLDSSRYIRIANCFIETGDDGIVIKSGKDADGLRVNKPTEHVTITNCTVRRAHGAVTLGSETAGGLHNIVASNIVCEGTQIGIRIKSRRGRGGYIDNVRFDNWTMENVGQAINITNFYKMEGEVFAGANDTTVTNRTPRFNDIDISNITIKNARVVMNVDGLPEMNIEGVHVTDLVGYAKVGIKLSNTKDLELHDVQVNTESGPAVLARDSKDLILDCVSSRTPHADAPIIRLDECPGAIVMNSKAYSGTNTFLACGPNELQWINMNGNFVYNAKKVTEEVKANFWTEDEPPTEGDKSSISK